VHEGVSHVPYCVFFHSQSCFFLQYQAETLNNPQNRDRILLQAVYLLFVRDIVEKYIWSPSGQTASPMVAGGAASRRSLRGAHRELVVFTSAKIIDIEFRECSPALKADPIAEDCQTAYAHYMVSGVLPGTQEPVYLFYTNLTQTKIANGELQEYMDREDPDARIRIEGATPELVVRTAAPTPSPALPGQSQLDDGRSSGTVLFVVVVGLLALIALGVYFAWNDKDKIKAKWRAWKKKRKEQNDEEQELNSQGEGIEGEEELQYDEEGKSATNYTARGPAAAETISLLELNPPFRQCDLSGRGIRRRRKRG
jgi:hypothetical protein